MSTNAMKLELIQWICQLNDQGLLATLHELKKANEDGEWFEKLTPEQKASVRAGEEDIKAGRLIPSAEVWKRHGRAPKS
ncbi:MAG: hypothetical protein WAT74_15810 [Flavobacteriales bacterium]